MLKNFYPALRNAGYLQVYYDIDRTASVATAVTDEHGRTTWIDPDSPENIGVTRINRAMRHMVEGDYEAALKELEGQQENPAAFNYIGVCYMMKGDYDTAEKISPESRSRRRSVRIGQSRTHRAGQKNRILEFYRREVSRHCLKTGDTRCICGGYLFVLVFRWYKF